MSTRSLIIRPRVRVRKSRTATHNTPRDPDRIHRTGYPEIHPPSLAEIRRTLLLWGKLILPQIDARRYEPIAELGHLVKEGLAEEIYTEPTKKRIWSEGEWDDLLTNAQLLTFNKIEGSRPGEASLLSPRQEIGALASAPGRALLVRLYDAIPVPVRETPVQDILEFRMRYRAEWLALRHHLEALYLRIAEAGDGPLAAHVEFESLSQAIADYVAALDLARLRFRFAGLEAKLKWEFDFPATAAFGALGVIAAGPFGAVAGLASNLIPRIEFAMGTTSVTSKRKSPLEYAWLLQRPL